MSARLSCTRKSLSIRAIFKRASRDSLATLMWPKGPMLLCAVFLVAFALEVLPTGYSGILERSSDLLGRAAIVAMALVFGAFGWNLFSAPYRIERDRADAAEARPPVPTPLDVDQIKHIIARYYESAHTFVHFWPSTRVSLTQNIQTICIHNHQEMSFYFLQALEKDSIVVRPMGGTPRIDIMSCDDWHVRIRIALSSDSVKLRIFGNIIPVLRNHPDAGLAQPIAMQASSPLPFPGSSSVIALDALR